METKEHVFLILPILAIIAATSLYALDFRRKKSRLSALFLIGTIVIIGFLIAIMGYIISTGARVALGG